MRLQSLCALCWVFLFSAGALPLKAAELTRPPAVPLVACDPYFSVWSQADRLTDVDTTHWTGRPHPLTSLVRVDGQAFRLMGAQPADVPAMPQVSVKVLPTQTVYQFAGSGVSVTLTFTTPALPEDVDILARPVTYLTYDVAATDGKSHAVQVALDASGLLAVNEPKQQVTGTVEEMDDVVAVKIGSVEQPVLAKSGDDLRIDWGYLYVAAAKSQKPGAVLASPVAFRKAFVAGDREAAVRAILPAPAGEVAGVLVFHLGTVADQPVSRWLMLAYDDLYSIQYMKENLRPYWRRNGWEAADLLAASAAEYASLRKRCDAFDQELMADLTRAGGPAYAQLGALAYRHCFAAGKFVADANGQPLQFCKENHSNGCIGTSDVFYPMAPQFLLLGPTLAKSFLVPFMNYATSERWRFPFAPHDLGTYPHANGQRYGGGERTEENQMPVEETGNLLILMGAIAQMEGNADFAGLYWPQLQRWAEYLRGKGFDPENQLCTDDFAGHLAHNINLSAKAICGLGAFAKLCEMRGEKALAEEYRAAAREFAARWVREARDGDHYRLAFDKPGTWSQKYNLVWDRILGLDLFPADVARTEMDYYKSIQNPFGLPLDNRAAYTKLDWILWTATLTQDRADFDALLTPVIQFLNETPDRSPMTDWYFTDTAKKRSFTARPVVGGVFLQMLYDRATWAKYAQRDATKASHWAPMPQPPVTKVLVPTSEEKPATWRYTTTAPPEGWMQPAFDDSAWSQGPGGFGAADTPGAVARTPWTTSEIWIRRTFELSEPLPARAALRMHHDEDAEVYLNGQRVAAPAGYTTAYEVTEIRADALRAGQNVLAIRCRQTMGGQYIDAGLDAIVTK